ncbi:apolipoprotein N-acyltransferase [Moraxella oculi]|uniref:Apolipoprotein N-acyltransferase n=1 Tax=Moraxella oculi TaxID=2940516 RepID=A0ABW8U6A8_9GAMM
MNLKSIRRPALSNQSGKTALASRLPIGLATVLALIAGMVFSLSLAPYYLWPVAIFSVMVLYALLVNEDSPVRAFWLGQLYGFGTWVVGASWLYHSIHEYGSIPSWIAAIMIVVMAMVMGLFQAFFAWAFVRFVGRQPLAFASLWVFQEWLKTWLLSGFPWLFVGYAFTEQSWLTGFAPVLGVFGVSFMAVLFSASLVELFRQNLRFFVLSALVLMLNAALSWVDWTWQKPNDRLSVSLVQGNIPQDLKWLTQYRERTLEIYADLSSNEWGRDVIIWPEAAIPMFHDEAAPFINRIANQALAKESAWVTGLMYRDFEQYDASKDSYPPIYNSAAAIDRHGISLYKKQHLVPFGEYIPFSGLFNILPNLANMQSMRSISAGDANQTPLMVKGRNVGAAICYEVAYPDTTRHNAKDAEVLLTISNDAWFGTTAGPWQHLQMVQMRSLETGRYFIRATNTGITAIINHKGKIQNIVPQFERTVLQGEVPMMMGVTPFVRFGNYPILGLSALLFLCSLMARQNQSASSAAQKYYTANGVRD